MSPGAKGALCVLPLCNCLTCLACHTCIACLTKHAIQASRNPEPGAAALASASSAGSSAVQRATFKTRGGAASAHGSGSQRLRTNKRTHGAIPSQPCRASLSAACKQTMLAWRLRMPSCVRRFQARKLRSRSRGLEQSRGALTSRSAPFVTRHSPTFPRKLFPAATSCAISARTPT